MKQTGIIFTVLTGFFVLITPIYWLMSKDPTGTSALVLTICLCLLVAFYTVVMARRLPPQPEDDKQGEIADIQGEYGFFSPYSWWPLALAGTLSVTALGLIFGPWLMIIGGGFGIVTLLGFVFEYYRGVHAH